MCFTWAQYAYIMYVQHIGDFATFTIHTIMVHMGVIFTYREILKPQI